MAQTSKSGTLSKNALVLIKALNGWAPATIEQLAGILNADYKTVSAAMRNLMQHRLAKCIGRPKLPTVHPLHGNYYIPSNIPVLGKILANARTVHTRAMKFYSPPISSGDVFFRAGDGHVDSWCKFSRHRIMVNYVASWVTKTSKANGLHVTLESEYDLRTIRKWHFSRTSNSTISAGGTQFAVPDFLVKTGKHELLIEVEFEQKNSDYYIRYFDHLDDYRVLYLVPTPNLGSSLMEFVPKNKFAEYAVIGHVDGLMSALRALNV